MRTQHEQQRDSKDCRNPGRLGLCQHQRGYGHDQSQMAQPSPLEGLVDRDEQIQQSQRCHAVGVGRQAPKPYRDTRDPAGVHPLYREIRRHNRNDATAGKKD